MSDFAVVIGFQFENEEYRSVVLDTVSDVRVDGNSNITEQPVVSGDIISDHMYNQPKSMSINGSLSMNDSKVTVIDGQGSKLANFQELFERIQREGVKCDIVKISIKNEDDVRFLHRRNMVVQTHGWTEKINSIDYTLRFKEVMTAEVITYDVDSDDAFLPNVTEPNTLSFTTTLIDWDAIDRSIIQILQDNELLDNMLLNALKSLGEDTLRSLVPTAVAIVLASIVGAGGPATWFLGAVVAAVAAAYIFIKGIFDFFKRLDKRKKYKIDAFTWSKNTKKTESEIKRFGEFVKGIHDEFEKVNSLIKVLQIPQDINQECLLSIGDSYYIFTFTRNNIDGKYSLKVEDINEKEVASKTDVTTSPTNFDQLNNNNKLFTANNNASVYLVYNPIIENENQIQETADPDPKDLRNYCVVVCDMDVDKFQEMVEDIIKSKILKDYN